MFDEPNMSDKTLLVSVEDLISIGMGPDDKNIVNFKVIQTVLHILARQQRMLQQRVEIRVTEVRQESPTVARQPKKTKKVKESEGSSPSSSPRTPPPKKRPPSAKDDKTKDASKVDKDKAKADKETKKKEEKEKAKSEKEREKELKAQEKADRSARKEKEKAEKAEQKELEKAQKEKSKSERAAEKEKEKAERAAEKEKEKAERAAEKKKERSEKADRVAEKEKERLEKAERKEKERAEKEAAKAQKEKERSDRSPSPAKDKKKKQVESVPSISISEVERGKEKVLVVEKGPTTRSEPRVRDGSIDVVTQSQFALLEAAVKGLMEKAAPMGELRLPDNQKLKSALAKGSASLTDTMQAMQVNARIKAAEEAIDRMAGLLTQLAAAGAVPEALADRVAEAKREAERTLTSDTDDGAPIKPRPSTARKSVAIDPMVKTSQIARPSTARASSVPTPRGSISTVMGRASVISQPSSTVTTVPEPKVTRGEMEDIIKSVKDDLWKNMNTMTTKATAAAETAMHTAKAVADKLDVALKLDNRITSLHSLVADYAEQLSGFDAGLTTQMQSFQEQIMQIRGDLTGGLKLLDTVNNNAETAAVLELTERYEELVSELDRTLSAHRALSEFQGQLGDELHSLVECVEMLREQKADRDEVIDGLRDKADTSRLAGLLTEAEFALARAELNRRLEVCHDKFRRQDGIWIGAIKDLLKTTDLKAEIIDLLSMRDDTQWQLRELHGKLKLLAAVLGEPKAALLTRQLARDAACGACGVAALMGMRDPSTGVPPAFPALRPPPPVEEPCLKDLKDWMPTEPADDRHICLRWCGGSHTLLSERTTREEAPPLQLAVPPTRKFADYGRDGRLYMMEEDLQPCVECNEMLEQEQEALQRPAPVGEEGAGDQGPRNTIIP